MFSKRRICNQKIVLIFVLLFVFCAWPLFAREQAESEDYFSMSLGELLSQDITLATLSGMKLSKVPAAITIITKEDIEKTPARNILDLIEVYVPGAMVRNHHAGPQVLMLRGQGERNYKTILLVNGRPINQKAFFGSTVEISNWDMNDIERIEVIRGPGSVTYGPGAIGGIINIITKQAGSLDGVKTGVEYNEGYDSKGAFLQYGFDKEKFKLFTHFSIRDTDGDDDPKYFHSTNSGAIGYSGTDEFSGSGGNPTQEYYRDYDDKPQIKAHLDLTYLEDWRFWLRYTSSGQAIPGDDNKNQFAGGSEWEIHRQWRAESFIAAVENTHNFSAALSLKSILSYDSENFIYAANGQMQYSNTDIRQRSYSFAENEVFARSILNYKPSEKLKAAVGLEYSYDWLGDNWGESDTFKARGGRKNFFSDTSLYNDIYDSSSVAEYTDGWDAHTYSVMAELDYTFMPQFQVLLSGRLDKNTYTGTMFSPRAAIISELSDKDIVKAIWQKSLRMNTMMELYYQDLEDLDVEPEKLTTYQLIYNRLQNENLSFQISTYYNETEILTWSGTNVEQGGEHDSYGAELEAKYKTDDDKRLFGINHSYFHLVDWDDYLKDTIGSRGQRVSYSDYYYEKGFLEFTDTGNSITYWADNITKLYARVKLSHNWTLHMDSRIVWEYNYGKDYMEMYKKAYDNVDISTLSAPDLATYNANKALLAKYERVMDDHDAFDMSWTFNASLSWDIPYFKKHKTTLTVYGQNLFDSGQENYGLIIVNDLPIICWQEEPRTFGVKLTAEF